MYPGGGRRTPEARRLRRRVCRNGPRGSSRMRRGRGARDSRQQLPVVNGSARGSGMRRGTPGSGFRIDRRAAAFAWMRSSPPTPTRRLLRTTCGSADRSHAYACFVLAEQASEKADQAHLVLVPCERPQRCAGDDRIQAKGAARQTAPLKARTTRRVCSSWVDDTTTADVIVALGSSVVAVLALSLAAWQHWRGRAFRNDP
jgi:hypothetical protein